MTAILTDRPLEEIMEHAPSRGEDYLEDELLIHGCVRIIRRDDIRLSYLKYFNCGFDQQVNNLLHTDVNHWYVYTLEEDTGLSIDVSTFLFVYWYLTKGKHIVLYRIENIPGFGPETMVSTIDIAPKGSGMTPKEEYHRNVPDVLYHFLDPSGSAHLHDTAILERMSKDEYFDENFLIGRIPNDHITLKELMEISGNCSMYTTVYDYDEAMSILSELGGILSARENEVWKKYAKPLELITSYEQYWEWKDRGGKTPPMTRKDSKYNDCQVKMYGLYSRSYVDMLSRICITDEPVDNNLIGLIAFI